MGLGGGFIMTIYLENGTRWVLPGGRNFGHRTENNTF
jgi:hypothetical protein